MKTSLHSQFPAHVGLLSLVFLLGNVGLQVFSHVGLSAVIKSNQDTSAATTQEGCSTDDAAFERYWNAPDGGRDTHEAVLQTCAQTPSSEWEQCIRENGFEGGDVCLACYVDATDCGSGCTAQTTDGFAQCFKGNGCDRSLQACTGEPTGNSTGCVSSDPVFADYWENGQGRVQYRALLRACALSSLGELAAFTTCMQDQGFEGGQDCLGCYKDAVRCGSVCFSCLSDSESEACLACIEERQCNQSFEECSGVKLADSTRRLLAVRASGRGHATNGPPVPVETHTRALEDDPVTLYIVYEISFISSVQDALDGGAYGIALVIILFSGVWPYLKNLIMFVAWFVPMEWTTRSTVLKNLTRLAKWSMVDVFAIVIIIAGINIDKQITETERLIVFAESRVAIYTFCIAAMWDLVQGEWMRHMHLKALALSSRTAHNLEAAAAQEGQAGDASMKLDSDVESLEQYDDQPMQIADSCTRGTAASSPSSPLDHPDAGVWQVEFGRADTVGCNKLGAAFVFTWMLTQQAFMVASFVLVCITFQLGGLIASLDGNGENEFSYTPISIATSLTSPEALEFNTSIPGTFFLVIVYLLMSVIIPLIESLAIMALAFVPWKKTGISNATLKTLYHAVDTVGGFACQDVFVLSFLVVTVEWDKLVDKSVGKQAAALCPSDEVSCLTMVAQVGTGIYIMMVAVVLCWGMELFFTQCYAFLFEPTEKMRASNRALYTATKAFGCGVVRVSGE